MRSRVFPDPPEDIVHASFHYPDARCGASGADRSTFPNAHEKFQAAARSAGDCHAFAIKPCGLEARRDEGGRHASAFALGPSSLSAGEGAGVKGQTKGEQAMARYGKKASQKVKEVMRERKRGTLRSGSGKKVTSRKQAIAIGLSEARRAGGKVPRKKRKS